MNQPDNNELKESETRKTLERIDGKYIWTEIRRVLNIDKGILYTIKELFLRPGNAIQEFLLYDRMRLVKPIIFVIFSSLIFIVAQKVFGFNTGAAPKNLDDAGVTKMFEWVGANFGIANIYLGFFIIGEVNTVNICFV